MSVSKICHETAEFSTKIVISEQIFNNVAEPRTAELRYKDKTWVFVLSYRDIKFVLSMEWRGKTKKTSQFLMNVKSILILRWKSCLRFFSISRTVIKALVVQSTKRIF